MRTNSLRKRLFLSLFLFLPVTLLLLYLSLLSSREVFSSSYKSEVYLIPVPSSCVYVKKVDNGEIYIEDIPGSEGKPECKKSSVMQINISSKDVKKVRIYYRDRLWKEVNLDLSNPDAMADYVAEIAFSGFYDRVSDLAPGSKLTYEQKEKIKESLNLVESRVNSREFQEEVLREKREIARILGIPFDESVLFNGTGTKRSSYETNLEDKLKSSSGNTTFKLLPDERLYVFVSKSVPLETIRTYVRDASRLDPEKIVFVLRGAVGGLTYITPTVEFVYSAIAVDPRCDLERDDCKVYPVRFLIDPFLFRRYGINEVPAVVYARGVERYLDLSEGLPETKVSDYYVSYGDVSLFYHLYVLGSASGNERMKVFAEKYLNYQVSGSQ